MTEAIIDLINRSKADDLVALVLIFGGSVVVGLVAIILTFIYKSRAREADMNLKHEMLARGMSADEIEKVLAATSSPTDLKRQLFLSGMSAEDIERVTATNSTGEKN